MKDDTRTTPLHQPGSIIDPLTEIAREGARRMLAAAHKASDVLNHIPKSLQPAVTADLRDRGGSGNLNRGDEWKIRATSA